MMRGLVGGLRPAFAIAWAGLTVAAFASACLAEEGMRVTIGDGATAFPATYHAPVLKSLGGSGRAEVHGGADAAGAVLVTPGPAGRQIAELVAPVFAGDGIAVLVPDLDSIPNDAKDEEVERIVAESVRRSSACVQWLRAREVRPRRVAALVGVRWGAAVAALTFGSCDGATALVVLAPDTERSTARLKSRSLKVAGRPMGDSLSPIPKAM
jgi:hypothetical protein